MLNGTKTQTPKRDRIMTRSQTKKNNVNQEVIDGVESSDVPDSSSINSLAGSPTLLNSDTSYIDEATPLPWFELDPYMQCPSSFDEPISPFLEDVDVAYEKDVTNGPIFPLEDISSDKYLPSCAVSGFDGYCDEDWVSLFTSAPQFLEEQWKDWILDFPMELLDAKTPLYTAKATIPFVDMSLKEEEKLSGELPIDPDQFFSDNMYITLGSSLVSFADDGSKKDEDKAQVNKTQEPVQLAKTSEPITPAFKAASQGNSSFPILPERKSKLVALKNMQRKRPF
jgi:hypothetical protein